MSLARVTVLGCLIENGSYMGDFDLHHTRFIVYDQHSGVPMISRGHEALLRLGTAIQTMTNTLYLASSGSA